MNRLINVARYHLVDRLQYVVLPCGITAFVFLVNLAVFALIGAPQAGDAHTASLVALYITLFVSALRSMTRSVPFGFALGLSRRTYYLGTVTLMLALSAAYSAGITVLQIVERLTGGWGVSIHVFRVPWLLDGSWAQTWLTSFVLLALAFAYGMWFGLVYRRWDIVGVVLFIAAQILLLLAVALLTTWSSAWPAVAGFFAMLSALGLTGVLAVCASALGVGGFFTMRRVTV